MFEAVRTDEERPIQELLNEFANAFHALVNHSQCPESLAAGIIDCIFDEAHRLNATDAADLARHYLRDMGQQFADGQEVAEVIEFHPELVV